MSHPVSRVFLGSFFIAILGLAGCKSAPKYPACETDEHCQADGRQEYCVNKQCQECRTSDDCDGSECVDGRCGAECVSDDDCADQGLVCRSGSCVPECTEDADCSGGWRCEGSRCVAACETDAECQPGETCVDGGCVEGSATNISASCRPTRAGDVVSLEAVNFDFNEYSLTVSARSALDTAAECLQMAPDLKIVVEGHADERGTQEYNLALGEKRANTVKRYLSQMGIDTSRMVTRSKGENEPVCNSATEDCFAQNRRVEFIQR